MTPEQQAEIERIRRAYAKFPGATVQTSAAVVVAALEAAQAEAERLRAENARLREALSQYAKRDDWQQAPSDFGNVDSDPYDWFMCDGNGWETAERALATNETPTA